MEAARDNGLLINHPRNHCLRIMPALNSTAEEIRLGLQLLGQTLAQFYPVPAAGVEPEMLAACK